MSSRTYACDEIEIIARRRDELERERLGCVCERDPYSGVLNHAADCPLGPGLPPATPPCPAMVARDWYEFEPQTPILDDPRRAVADAIDEQETGR